VNSAGCSAQANYQEPSSQVASGLSAATAAEQFADIAEQARSSVLQQRAEAAAGSDSSSSSSLSSIGERSASSQAVGHQYTVHDCPLYQPTSAPVHKTARHRAEAQSIMSDSEGDDSKEHKRKQKYCGAPGIPFLNFNYDFEVACQKPHAAQLASKKFGNPRELLDKAVNLTEPEHRARQVLQWAITELNPELEQTLLGRVCSSEYPASCHERVLKAHGNNPAW